LSDYDSGVVIRFALAQRGTRVLDLGQRRGSRFPCGRKNIQPTSGNRISQKKDTANFAVTEFSEVRQELIEHSLLHA
jgi:hypothetical protein